MIVGSSSRIQSRSILYLIIALIPEKAQMHPKFHWCLVSTYVIILQL
jgi:hypothetical protein